MMMMFLANILFLAAKTIIVWFMLLGLSLCVIKRFIWLERQLNLFFMIYKYLCTYNVKLYIHTHCAFYYWIYYLSHTHHIQTHFQTFLHIYSDIAYLLFVIKQLLVQLLQKKIKSTLHFDKWTFNRATFFIGKAIVKYMIISPMILELNQFLVWVDKDMFCKE